MKLNILLHKDECSLYGVTVPALPGVFSCGIDAEEAVENTKEAIISHLETMNDLGEPIVIDERSLEELKADPDFVGGDWVEIEVNLSQFGL